MNPRRVHGQHLVALGLFVGFWAIYYFSIGVETPNLSWYNFVFDADPARIIDDALKGQNPAVFERHPLFALTIGMVAQILDTVLGARESVLGAVSCLAAAGVAGSYVLFRRFVGRDWPALLLALLGGFSASQWVMGSIPETFAVTSAIIVATFLMHGDAYVQPRRHPGRFALTVFVGALGTGVAVPNIVYATLGHASALRNIEKGKRRLGALAFFVAATAVTFAALGLVQKAAFPAKTPVGNVLPTPVGAALRDPLLQLHPIVAADVLRLARAFTADNVVAPPAVIETKRTYDGPLTMIQFGDGWSAVYALAMIAMIALTATVVWHGWRRAVDNHAVHLAAAMVGYNLAFHFFYRAMGQPFIFTVHTIVPLLVILAALFGATSFRFKTHLLALATVFVVANNFQFLRFVDMALSLACDERVGNVCLGWMGHRDDTRVTGGVPAFERSADYPFELGRVAFVEERYDASLPHFRRALQLEPGYALPSMYLGAAYLRMNQPDSGVAILESSLRRNPGNVELERLLQAARELREILRR